MDITTPRARSTIVHWEHKRTRLIFFKFLLTLILIFQGLLISTVNEHVTASRLATWVASWIIISLILITFTLIEYIFFSNKRFSNFYAYNASYQREFAVRTFITIFIAVMHHFHQGGIKLVFNGILLRNGCPACLKDAMSAGLVEIGRAYIEEFFATVLSIATLWCFSPRSIFLRSIMSAVFWTTVKYAVCVVATFTATSMVWKAYCSGYEVCWGNMGVAGWALAWIPLGRSIGHLGPFVNLVGKEVLKEYPHMVQG